MPGRPKAAKLARLPAYTQNSAMPIGDNLLFQSDSYKWTHPGMMSAEVRHEYLLSRIT